MGCFLRNDESLFIIDAEQIEDCINEVKNAIVEKKNYYWKVEKAVFGAQLQHNQNYVVKNKRPLENYCDLCKDRLIHITNGCKSCIFRPIEEFSEMDIDGLIDSIKNKGFYEVDQEIFKKEIEEKKSRN